MARAPKIPNKVASLVRSGGGQMRPPKPATPPGKPGVHDPEPQAGPVPKPKPPGAFKPTFGRPPAGVKF